MKVVFLPEMEKYLFDLVEILYQKEYFGFKESAFHYITDLIQDIIQNIHNKQKRIAPSYFSKYGESMHYSIFKKSKNTQWYGMYSLVFIRGMEKRLI